MAESDDRIIRIENKIDTMADHVSSINITLAAQHESLKDHMRRTEILEETIKPITKHDHMVLGAVKLILLVTAILGGAEGIVAVMNYISRKV